MNIKKCIIRKKSNSYNQQIIINYSFREYKVNINLNCTSKVERNFQTGISVQPVDRFIKQYLQSNVKHNIELLLEFLQAPPVEREQSGTVGTDADDLVQTMKTNVNQLKMISSDITSTESALENLREIATAIGIDLQTGGGSLKVSRRRTSRKKASKKSRRRSRKKVSKKSRRRTRRKASKKSRRRSRKVSRRRSRRKASKKSRRRSRKKVSKKSRRRSRKKVSRKSKNTKCK